MDLIFLYGPPGVGKLTVGAALAARTGYRLLHNHLTIDLVTALFPFGSAPFGRLVDRFRLGLLAEAARERLPGVITTLVYARGDDDPFVDATIAAIAPHGGRFCPVLLTCAEPELLRRVGQESRAPRQAARPGAGPRPPRAPHPHRAPPPGAEPPPRHRPPRARRRGGADRAALRAAGARADVGDSGASPNSPRAVCYPWPVARVAKERRA